MKNISGLSRNYVLPFGGGVPDLSALFWPGEPQRAAAVVSILWYYYYLCYKRIATKNLEGIAPFLKAF